MIASFTPGEQRRIPLDQIDDPALPSRAAMDDDKFEELVQSIRRNGVLQPIIVKPNGERWEVVAGHRRTMASRRALLVDMPAVLYPADHPRLIEIQAAENSKREDLNPVDEAEWFFTLLEKHCGNDVDRVAALVGESRNYVQNRLELLELDDDTREAVRAGKIKIGAARELLKITDPHYRRHYLYHAIQGGASVTMVASWVQDWRNTFGAQVEPIAPAAAAASAPIASSFDPMRCAVCEKSDTRHIPQQIAIHEHCWLAFVEPFLKQMRGES